MDKRTYDRESAERMTPLLRSITRELRERQRAIDLLQRDLSLAQREVTRHAEVPLLEAALAGQRRELRQVTKEVTRLGLALDAEHPLRILIPTADGAWAYEGVLDDTQFFRQLEGLPV